MKYTKISMQSKRFDTDTKPKTNYGSKKYIFALANLQNYKRLKIIVEDMMYQVC